jgi:hypothetical protein
MSAIVVRNSDRDSFIPGSTGTMVEALMLAVTPWWSGDSPHSLHLARPARWKSLKVIGGSTEAVGVTAFVL